ncbi:MAG: serine/threonine-protein kinase [Anaerolineales bacterium]
MQNIGGYELGRSLGAGAMGAVYAATALDHPWGQVAVKVLHPEVAAQADLRARFAREMRLLAALDHPGIVPLVDYGEADGHLYLVMPLIEGKTLTRVMRQRTFSLAAAWNVLRPVIDALAYGHQQGILHRDVKPGNVLLAQKPEGLHIYLMDYGLGKQPGTDKTLTATGISVGTPEYISPEAALGTHIDARADLYSLAVMAYELMLGRLPFDYRDAARNALAHVDDPPPHPSAIDARFPPEIADILLGGLAKAPEDRPASVAAFGTALFAALQRLPAATRDTVYGPA